MQPFFILIVFLSIPLINASITVQSARDLDKLLVQAVESIGEKMIDQMKSELATMDPVEAAALAPIMYGRLGAQLELMLLSARQGAREAARGGVRLKKCYFPVIISNLNYHYHR